MTDNRTTERLMAMLEERGVKHELEHDLYVEWVDARGNDVTAFETSCKHKGDVLIVHVFLTPEQAIAATLGSDEPPYDELLRCLENDWHIRASWDGLCKFWCIELTEEGVKLRDATHGTLTAEQVREAVMSADRWEKPMGDTGLTNTHLIIRDDGWQAIADELNAELGSGTCEMYRDEIGMWHCKACESGADADGDGTLYEWCDSWAPNFCPLCGKRVREAMGR